MIVRIFLTVALVPLVGSVADAGTRLGSWAIEAGDSVSENAVETLLQDHYDQEDEQSKHVQERPASNLAGTTSVISGITSSPPATITAESLLETPVLTVVCVTLANQCLPPSPDLGGLLKPPQG